jgi:hypothetical protein
MNEQLVLLLKLGHPVRLTAEQASELFREFQRLSVENASLVNTNYELSQKPDQQGRINALEAALDCLQYEIFLSIDSVPWIKPCLKQTLKIQDELGTEADAFRKEQPIQPPR